jgi:dephospho-CoA kinase
MELMEQAARDPGVLAYVWDSPLLLEAGLDELCDTVIFVDAPMEDRLRRVAERGWDASELDRREKVQMPLDKKRAKAEYHLVNADARPATTGDVRAMLKEILERFEPASAGACASPCACGRSPGEGRPSHQAGDSSRTSCPGRIDIVTDGKM